MDFAGGDGWMMPQDYAMYVLSPPLPVAASLACETAIIEKPVPFWVRFRTAIGAITIQVIIRSDVTPFTVGFDFCFFSVVSLAPTATRVGRAVFDQID
jgi:hypothetical protein